MTDCQIDWKSPDTAPIDGQEFLAELSNGWVVILYATGSVRLRRRYSWWGTRGSVVDVPYEPTHPSSDWSDTTMRLTGWMTLPKSRQQIAREMEEENVSEIVTVTPSTIALALLTKAKECDAEFKRLGTPAGSTAHMCANVWRAAAAIACPETVKETAR